MNFTNNTFNSEDYHFFLQDGARTTSIVFDGNTVNALTLKGTMFANYSGKQCGFTKLQVTNNVFNGLSRKSIDDSFKSIKNKTIFEKAQTKFIQYIIQVLNLYISNINKTIESL